MALIDDIKLFSKLPFRKDYNERQAAADFYQLSYEASGPEYTRGSAPDGRIIHRTECESHSDYSYRCSTTPIRSYVSSILNKYNASVFRNEPTRELKSATAQLLYRDADGYGASLNDVMRAALKHAQVAGSCFLLADSTATDTELLTIAQSRASGVRPYIRTVTSDCVVNYEAVEGTILAAIVLMVDENGVDFARYMDASQFVDISLGKNYRVTEMSEAYDHGYDGIPLVEIKPLEDAQAKPISYAQRGIMNILSLLEQELTDSVFTKWILSGARLPQDENGQSGKITWSGKRMVVLEDPGAKLDQLGADHGCADSLRKQLEVEELQLYKAAGFAGSNVNEVTNASGISLAIQREDYFAMCSLLMHAVERAENKVLYLIASKERTEYIPAAYSSRYIADDSGEHLLRLRDLLALPLPATFKKLAIREYIHIFYNVSDADQEAIEAELVSDLV